MIVLVVGLDGLAGLGFRCIFLFILHAFFLHFLGLHLLLIQDLIFFVVILLFLLIKAIDQVLGLFILLVLRYLVLMHGFHLRLVTVVLFFFVFLRDILEAIVLDLFDDPVDGSHEIDDHHQ